MMKNSTRHWGFSLKVQIARDVYINFIIKLYCLYVLLDNPTLNQSVNMVNGSLPSENDKGGEANLQLGTYVDNSNAISAHWFINEMHILIYDITRSATL